jgi:hypothetical protein
VKRQMESYSGSITPDTSVANYAPRRAVILTRQFRAGGGLESG